ncbi:MAG: 5'-nucleotidase C-terminal domain-containing protein, partial [Pseudomonadota bacterium]
FAPLIETAESLATELRDGGADLVIALAHTDISEDRELVDAGVVDMVLSGDDHLLSLHYNGDVALVESYAQAEYVTAIDLALDRVERGDSTRFVWTPSFRVIDTVSAPFDAEVKEMVDGYLDLLSAELDIEIGTIETELDSRRSTIRAQEATIGNLIADAMREAVGADIAITNGGGIRADKIYDPGTTLTRRDIQTELPFGNKTVSIALTGQNIMDALENGFSAIEDGSGRFPHVSGLSVTYDPAAEPGSRVQSVIVGDSEIDLGAVYTVATNDFMAGGGDGYSALTGGKMVIGPTAGRFMAAQVIEYIEANSPVAPVIEGRINAAN